MILTKQRYDSPPAPGDKFERKIVNGRLTVSIPIKEYLGYRPGGIYVVKDSAGAEILIRRNNVGKWAEY